MKDVAKHAGVSVSTVSYVLNDSGPVAAPRRARVLEAIRALEYTPNESARSLKRRSASTIGLVVPDLSNQFFALVAEGVEREASARGVLVVLCVPGATDVPEAQHAALLRGQRLDGVVYLSGTGTAPREILELADSGHIVLVDEQIAGFDLPSVVADGRRGAREIAASVLQMGHRQLAVIGGPAALWTAEQRLAGYREAFAGAGIDPDEVPVYTGDYRMASGERLAEEALTCAGPRPTALLCANDLMAIGALEYCKREGLRVPEDVSIAGFDDLPIAALLTPRLTTVRQPAAEMGAMAARLLFELIDGRSSDGDEYSEPLPAELLLRESVGPAPRG
ncbi:unannotated protein [freshwater metagenome]|uniref:Unannotated protein n=1 Tax=freshwater metagenome TaxID=449393 RepID=A0A6J7CJX9_9ZZZZ|nr:LacI family DNA-binding transcriptional regulator [Actinomycetota bacterium]